MKLTSLVILLTAIIATETSAQHIDPDQLSKNGVFAEIYIFRPDFSDGFVSINYERVLGRKKRLNLRTGIWPDFQSTLSIPLTFSWITGPYKTHHLEYGAGIVFRIEHYLDSDDPTQVKTWFYDIPALMVPLMYRYQKANGFYFRGGINLFLSWPTLPSPTLSMGYRF